jgi:U3 small nucleolar RNA-associated protein 24
VILGCVLAELEKLGSRYAIARRIAKDERWRRIPCSHRGTYADDCIVRTVSPGVFPLRGCCGFADVGKR